MIIITGIVSFLCSHIIFTHYEYKKYQNAVNEYKRIVNEDINTIRKLDNELKYNYINYSEITDLERKLYNVMYNNQIDILEKFKSNKKLNLDINKNIIILNNYKKN